MSQEQGTSSIDLIRWTFTVNPAHRAEIEGHLGDLGLDVFVQGESTFHVMWEEPDREVDEVIEEIWALNGEPFEVTQEEFHRVGLHTLHHADDEPAQEAA
jgi:hypothetical protein